MQVYTIIHASHILLMYKLGRCDMYIYLDVMVLVFITTYDCPSFYWYNSRGKSTIHIPLFYAAFYREWSNHGNEFVAFPFDLEQCAKWLMIVFSMFVIFDANFSKVIAHTPSRVYNHFWSKVVHAHPAWLSGSVQLCIDEIGSVNWDCVIYWWNSATRSWDNSSI